MVVGRVAGYGVILRCGPFVVKSALIFGFAMKTTELAYTAIRGIVDQEEVA